MPSPTITAELASDRLGRPVVDWITEQRAAGASWSLITVRLYEATRMEVTPTTMRVWLQRSEAA